MVVIILAAVAGLLAIALGIRWSYLRSPTRMFLGGCIVALLGGIAIIAGVYLGWGGSVCNPSADCSGYLARASMSHAIFDIGRALLVLAVALVIAAAARGARLLIVGRDTGGPPDVRE